VKHANLVDYGAHAVGDKIVMDCAARHVRRLK
jgi:hypothetical protein